MSKPANVRDAPVRLAATTDPLLEMLRDPVRDQEMGVLRPAIETLRLPDLLLAEGLAVDLGRIHLVGRAVANVAVENNKGRRLPFVLRKTSSGR